MDEILMRTQIPVFHQLRYGNHFVDVPAKRLIPFPFTEIRVIGRRSGQRERLLGHQMLVEIGKRFPPLLPQMMGFIETEQGNLGRFEDVDDLIGLLLPEPAGCGDGILFFPPIFFFRLTVLLRIFKSAESGQQGLIGNDGDVSRLADIGRDDPVILLLEKGRADPLRPLILNRVRRTQHQGRTVQARNDLDAQSRLPGTRSRHYVKFMITQVEIQIIQDPFLVTPPSTVKVKYAI